MDCVTPQRYTQIERERERERGKKREREIGTNCSYTQAEMGRGKKNESG